MFALGLATRLAYVLLVDEPILYTSQYFYLFGALRIVEHPDPLRLVATSDEWRLWGGHWTIAPLYYLFAAAVLNVFGAALLPLQVGQCLLGAVSAVAVGVLGREAAGRRGAWAGAAYAVYWPSVEMSRRLLTENLHVVLVVSGLALLARGARRLGSREAAAGGALLGLSALARSVSLLFLPLAAWFARPARGSRRRWALPAAVLVAAAAAILPWSARNLIGTGSLAPIETVGAYNLLKDNAYEQRRRYQGDFFFESKDPTEAFRSAPRFILRGLSRNPAALLDKLDRNIGHLFRAEGLHMVLSVERQAPVWLLAASVLADDLLLFAAWPLCAAYVLAGAPSVARRLIVCWALYYAFMIAVVFHVETRYRSALVPVVLAGAAGGASVLASGFAGRRRWRVVAGLLLGGVVAFVNLRAYLPNAVRALRASSAMDRAVDALARGDLSTARSHAGAAVARDPSAARPWLRWGGALAHAGHPGEAAEAYRRAAAVFRRDPVPTVVLPQLLREAGRPEEARAALAAAHDAARRTDNWIALEGAWNELPPPRRDEIRVGDDDYGAVRGFFHARGTYRWTRGRAFLRLMPTVAAAAYDVRLVMGSPEPSPFAAPVVTVRPVGGRESRFTLGRASAAFTVKARPAPGAPVTVEIESPVWTRLGENAEQGVIIQLMTVTAARE